MIENNYKEIKIVDPKEPKSIEVTFEEDPKTEAQVKVEDEIKDIDLKDLAPEKKEETKPKEAQVKPKMDKKVSRSQKRIRQVLASNKEITERAEKAEEETRELKKLLKEGTKKSSTSVKGTLESQIKVLTQSMKEAMQGGDSDLVVDLQDSLINAKMELASVNHELKVAESVINESPIKVEKVQPQLPEKALDWLEEHSSFETDELFRVSTITINNQLLREGFDINSTEFYEELSTRLAKRFPEEFGVDDKNSVELKEDTKQSSDDTKDVKNKSSSAKTRSVEQTVSGSSRPSTMSNDSPIKKNSVTLSPDDIEQAEKWGLTLEQMARRIAHSEKNRRDDGYVPIMYNN